MNYTQDFKFDRKFEVLQDIAVMAYDDNLEEIELFIPKGAILPARPECGINRINNTFDSLYNDIEVEIDLDKEYVREV